MQPTSLSSLGWRRPADDQCVLLTKVDHRLVDFCDKVAFINQLDSGLNNEIGLAIDIIHLCHVMRHEVDSCF